MTPAERYFYDRGRYGTVAFKVDLCMRLQSRPCAGGECEEQHLCQRHERIVRVVERYIGLHGRALEREGRGAGSGL